MKNRIYPFTNAGYGNTNPWVVNRRLVQWETHLGASQKTSPAMPSATHPDEHKVDDFVLQKTEMLVIELLTHSHSELVALTKEVKDAFHVHKTTARITTLIYRAIRDAGEANGMVSGRHREMIAIGYFSSNAVARAYAVAQVAIARGAKHSILSAFAQAAKLAAAPSKWQPAPAPVRIPSPTSVGKSSPVHKKSPPKKGGDWDFYDR